MNNKLKNNNLQIDTWLNIKYKLNELVLLDNKIIKLYFNKFWNDIMNNLEKDQVVLFIFKVRLGHEFDIEYIGNYLTIGKLYKINNSQEDFNKLLDFLTELLALKDESYSNLPLQEIIFSYKIISTDNTKINKNTISNISKNKKVKSYIFKGYNLPNTMDIKLWGKFISKNNNIILIRKKGSKFNYEIESIISNNEIINNIKIIHTDYNNNNILLTFKDIKNIKDNINTFTRYIGYNEYYFIDGKLELGINSRKNDFLRKINIFKNKSGKNIIPIIDNNILILDIETQVINNIIKPILITIYDGLNYNNFYLPDFKSESDMINSALNYLLSPNFNNYKIYIHNSSNFDIIFLMKYIINLKYNNEDIIINPTMKDGKFINIDIKFNDYKISFRDSLLILLSSLDKLSKAFNVESKGKFDFKSVDNLTINELNNSKIRKDLINYCNLDCKILYDILIKFNYIIFDLFKININKYPTLPSLAFGIFRSKYLNNNEIPILAGHIYHDIKNSYTGGSTDVILNHGKNLFYYDVNALYPFNMLTKDMPIGNIKAFTGNIWNIQPNAFGFFNCIIETPNDLNIPMLQLHYNNKTISPLGKFKGWFFSEELKFAINNFGYKIEILNGYTFDHKIIFKDYINDLYNLRLKYDKTNPLNLIAKILMNSLYGRFGLNYLLNKSYIINKNELDYLIDSNEINDFIDLDNKLLVNLLEEDRLFNSLFNSFDKNANSNIAIASAISAYSRIFLNEIKKYCIDNNIKIYYFDTDSIFTDKPLPDYMIDKGIGKFKLEDKIKEAVFIAPKVYGYINNNGKEIIKIKGYKNIISYNELKSLLIKDSKLELPQNKWYKSFENGVITIKNQIYTLIPTLNKRQLIYKNNKLVRTIPFNINNIKKDK